MFKTFGTSKEVFVNQDEGMFIALPITLDADTYTLETETEGGRTYVKAGSVVKEGTTVRGILPERYDITEGVAQARVAVRGYAWASMLTDAALEAASSLPEIVIMPYKSVFVALVSEDTENHKAVITVTEGSKFASTVAASDFTVTGLTLNEGGVTYNSDGTVTLAFSAGGAGKITAIKGTAFVAATGATLKGVPMDLNVQEEGRNGRYI